MIHLKLFESFGSKYEEYFTDLLDYGFELNHNIDKKKDDIDISFKKIIEDCSSLSYNSASFRVTKDSSIRGGDPCYNYLIDSLDESFKRLIAIEGFESVSALIFGAFYYDTNMNRMYAIVINIFLV